MCLALISLCSGMCWGAEKQVPSDSILQTTWKSLFSVLIPQMCFPRPDRAFREPPELLLRRGFSTPSSLRHCHPVQLRTWCSVWFFEGICHVGVIRRTAKARFALQGSKGARCLCPG